MTRASRRPVGSDQRLSEVEPEQEVNRRNHNQGQVRLLHRDPVQSPGSRRQRRRCLWKLNVPKQLWRFMYCSQSFVFLVETLEESNKKSERLLFREFLGVLPFPARCLTAGEVWPDGGAVGQGRGALRQLGFIQPTGITVLRPLQKED